MKLYRSILMIGISTSFLAGIASVYFTFFNPLLFPTTLNLVLCLMVFILVYLNKIKLYEPIIPVTITWLFFFVLRPYYIIIFNDYGFLLTKGAKIEHTYSAQWMVFFSLTFFLLGYFLIRKMDLSSKTKFKSNINLKKYKINLFTLFVLIMPLFVIYIYFQGAIGYANQHDSFVSQNAYFYQSKLILITIGYALLSIKLFHKNNKKNVKNYTVLLVNIPLLWMIVTGGSRIPIIIYGLAVFIIWIIKNNRKRAPINLIVILASFGILLMNWIGRIRTSISSKGLEGNISYSFSESTSILFSSNGDLNIFDTWAIVYHYSDLLPKNFGFAFVQLFLHPIPGSIWTSKPEVPSNQYMKILMPYYYSEGIGFSSSILGDFLLMFGKIGIIPLMLLFGIICGVIIKKVVSKNTFSSWILYAPFYGWLPLFIRGEIITTSVLLAAYIFPLGIIHFIAKKQWKKIISI